MTAGKPSGRELARSDARPEPAHFAAPVCRNCGARQDTPFCGQCGQPKARRLGMGDVGTEAWQRWRVFEWEVMGSVLRLIRAPGKVAREYVLGARRRHVHPLKLLLVAIALLMLALGASNYLESRHAEVNEVMALVRRYANWSFARSIVALTITSLLLFPRRFGYNFTEHLVLATYCQVLIIVAALAGALPTLAWNSPEAVLTHRQVMGLVMISLKALIVAVAFTQFFRVDLRRQGWRVALAVLVFSALDWSLLQLYSRLVTRLVLSQLV